MANDQSEKRGALSLYADAVADQPKWDLIGPTADDDIRRAIWRYGAEAVKAAVKEATKAKRGRRREPDWPELRDVIHADALEWLAGGDPFAARSNYAIAMDFAKRNPGHSPVSTHKRIERKLSRGPHDRRWFTLATAMSLSRDGWPYAAHLRALEALARLPEPTQPDVWQVSLERARATITDYEAREGTPPAATMTINEIEDAVREGGLAALIAPPRRGGLFGLAPPRQSSSGNSTLGSILSDSVDEAKE